MPVAPGATLDEALGGGEDYELLIAVSEDEAPELTDRFTVAGLRRPIPIGLFTEDRGVRTLGGRVLDRLGWQHRLG